MTPKRLIPIVAAAAVCALVAPAGSALAATDAQQASSANWSGYVVSPASGSGAGFRSVSGSWVAPKATCTSGQSYSAFWVGLGGSGTSSATSSQTDALEQAGTEADCSASGAVTSFAWYELVPSAPVRVPMTVHAGDRMSSRVTVQGTQVAISLTDTTTGATFSKVLTMSNPDTSTAEWIAEAPSSCSQDASGCTPLPLSDFGELTFTSATATTTAGHAGTISDPAFHADAVTLNPESSSIGEASYQLAGAGATGGAAPTSLSSDGSSFSVSYSASGSASGSGSAAGGGGSGDPYGDGGSGYGGSTGYGYGGGYGGSTGYGYGGGYGVSTGYGYGGGYGYGMSPGDGEAGYGPSGIVIAAY